MKLVPEQALPDAVVHVDLDGAKAIFEANGRPYEYHDDPLFESGLLNMLELFDRCRVKATLFTIASDLASDRKRELLLEAVRRGHEIASHSLTHPRLSMLSIEEKRTEIMESRARLESELGVCVRGFRAPSYEVDRDCLELLEEYGYKWDSSVFPAEQFAHRLGLQNIPAAPHRPFCDSELIELPLPGYEWRPFPFHPCYSLMLGDRYFSSGLRRFRKTGHPLILLFHLTDTANPLPRDRIPGWRIKFMTLSHIEAERKCGRCARMLREVGELYSITTTDALIEKQNHLLGKQIC